MFENITKFFKKFGKNEKENSKTTAKERLHLVLAQDRANISADFLDMMKQEIIEVIKKYIDIDEEAIDVRMTNKPGEDGTVGAPALYANIPILTIKNDARKLGKETSGTSENTEDEKIEVAATIEEKQDASETEKNEQVEEEKLEEERPGGETNKEETKDAKVEEEAVKMEQSKQNEEHKEKSEAVKKATKSSKDKPKEKSTQKVKNKKRGTNK